MIATVLCIWLFVCIGLLQQAVQFKLLFAFRFVLLSANNVTPLCKSMGSNFAFILVAVLNQFTSNKDTDKDIDRVHNSIIECKMDVLLIWRTFLDYTMKSCKCFLTRVTFLMNQLQKCLEGSPTPTDSF